STLSSLCSDRVDMPASAAARFCVGFFGGFDVGFPAAYHADRDISKACQGFSCPERAQVGGFFGHFWTAEPTRAAAPAPPCPRLEDGPAIGRPQPKARLGF